MLKTTLTAALIFGSVSVALATEFDPNLGNRYPQAASRVLEGRNVALTGSQTIVSGAQIDRASNPSAGGGF